MLPAVAVVQEGEPMVTQPIPMNLPLNWDLALGPALLVALLVVVAVGVVLTLSASLTSDGASRPTDVAALRSPRPVRTRRRRSLQGRPRPIAA
jgi:hypothetical protein